jgi:hypothetical protein
VACQKKENGGLGVRDLKEVNLRLLMKWCWRILQSGDTGLWKDILKAKYGACFLNNATWDNCPQPSFASLWLKDIWRLKSSVESKNCVMEAFSRFIGNGARANCWCDKWARDSTLSSRFPRLFSISSQKEATNSEMVTMEADSLRWNLVWRRRLFIWEEDCYSTFDFVGGCEALERGG